MQEDRSNGLASFIASIPEPAEPKDLFQALLGAVFGPDSWILYVFVFATWVLAWYSFVRSAHSRTQAAVSRIAATEPGQRATLAFWTLLTIFSQGAYLVISFFIGSHIYRAVSETDGPADVDFGAWFTDPVSSPASDPAFWIWFLIAIGIVAIGWASAQGETGLRVFSWFPLIGGFIACFIPFLVALEQPDPVTVERMKTFGLLLITYEVSAVITVYAPAACLRSWRKAERV
jgi:hypothetical protein